MAFLRALTTDPNDVGVAGRPNRTNFNVVTAGGDIGPGSEADPNVVVAGGVIV